MDFCIAKTKAMKTILVPVDFSETAYNAAVYAFQLAKQVAANKVVLYHAYELPVVADGGLAIPLMVSVDDVKRNSTEALHNVLEKLKQEFEYFPFTIETYNSYNAVITGITETAKQLKADLIVMGITGGNAVEEVLVGSNTIDVAKHTKIPVIIVPPKAIFNPIRNVLLSCNLEHIYETTPVDLITRFLDSTKATLQILHLEPDPTVADFSGTYFESVSLNTFFEGYEPKYHFIHNPNFVEGVNEFTDSNSIDILIVVPQKHGLFDSLFNKSHTKMLAFHSHVPVLIAHE